MHFSDGKGLRETLSHVLEGRKEGDFEAACTTAACSDQDIGCITDVSPLAAEGERDIKLVLSTARFASTIEHIFSGRVWTFLLVTSCSSFHMHPTSAGATLSGFKRSKSVGPVLADAVTRVMKAAQLAVRPSLDLRAGDAAGGRDS